MLENYHQCLYPDLNFVRVFKITWCWPQVAPGTPQCDTVKAKYFLTPISKNPRQAPLKKSP